MLGILIKLLDTFKERQTSKLLFSIRQQILAKIQSPYFSPEIQPYFANVNNSGEPFTNFAAEPKQVAQIKEIINGIYHAELAFHDLETVNLRNKKNWLHDFKKLWFHTVKHAYHASYLLTHLGIDLTDIFSTEIKQVLNLLHILTEFSDKYFNDASALATKLAEYPISYNAGLLGGIAVDQMKAGSGNIDYHFLTEFSSILPGYIQQISNYIQLYSPKLTSVKPTIDQEKLDKLQKEGLKLLNSLEALQNDNNLFLSVKAVYYIDILRHVIFLSQSTLEQMKNLDESSQEVIRNNLAELKYKWLAPLLGLADRIEDEALLAPGTLSQPLMAQLKPFYKVLIQYTSSLVNFSLKGQELLTIEDDKFTDLRLAETRQRIHQANRRLAQLENTENAFNEFFSILEEPQYADQKIIFLNHRLTKGALVRAYRFLQPYIKQLDVNLNNTIIKALTETTDAQFWMPSAHEKLKTKDILVIKDKLQALITGDKATQQFHIKLNENIIQSIEKHSERPLYPYEQKHSQFLTNEFAVLEDKSDLQTGDFSVDKSENCLLINPEKIDADQAFVLYEYHKDKMLQLQKAQTAYNQFYVIIDSLQPKVLSEIDNEGRSELQRLFCLFQPYLVETRSAAPLSSLYNKDIVDALWGRPLNPQSLLTTPLSTTFFIRNEPSMRFWFRNTMAFSEQRAQLFKEMAYLKLKKTTEAQPLTPESTSQRTDHLIKHIDYSMAIGEFKESVFKLKNLFNDAFRAELEPTRSKIPFVDGVPFPALQNRNKALAQAQQVIGIKRIANCIYHLEKTLLQLEKLNNNSFEVTYVFHLLVAHKHINELIGLSKALYKDPHLRVLFEDLEKKGKNLVALLVNQSKPYRMEPSSVILPEMDKKIRYGGIWYSLNAFMLIPNHITSLLKQKDLSPTEAKIVASRTKQIVLNIESIIESSDSYFKLFLKTPMMYKLFKELKQRLKHFSMLSHDAVMANLEQINTDLFTRILLEADEWEDRVGLKPGQLSGPMKTVLDEFYKGLVEPLGLISSKHIGLLTSEKPIEQRTESVQKRKAKAQTEKRELMPNYLALKELMRCIKIYQNFITPGFGPPQSQYLISVARHDLLEAFKKVLPILKENTALIATLSGEIEASPQIDELLGPMLLGEVQVGHQSTAQQPEVKPVTAEEKKKPNITAQCRIVYSYYKGLMKTCELKEKTALEKENYLDELKAQQVFHKEKMTNNYIRDTFKKAIDEVLGPEIPLEMLIAQEQVNSQQINKLDAKRLKNQLDYEQLKQLMSLFESYTKAITPRLVPPPPHFIALLENRLASVFKQTLPILKQHSALMASLSGEIEPSPEIDRIVGKILDKPEELSQNKQQSEVRVAQESPINKIHLVAQCQIVLSHYQKMVKAGEIMETSTAENQQYLDELKAQQALLEKKITDNAAAFKKGIASLDKKIDLHYTKDEYMQRLREYLLTWEKTLLTVAKNAEDIDKLVKKTIEDQVKNFEDNFYKQYAQLDMIIAGIKKFEAYFATTEAELKKNNSLFETSVTLERKKQIIAHLKNIAANPQVTPQRRIDEMKELIGKTLIFDNEKGTFEQIMLTHSHPDPFTLNWLKQLVLSFLQFFDLYIPEHQETYEEFNDAIFNPTRQSSLNRYSLFNLSNPRYKLPQPILATVRPVTERAAEDTTVPQNIPSAVS